MLKHRFFGKNCLINRALSDRVGLNSILKDEGFSNNHTLFLNQIHSNKVVVIDDESKIYGEQNLPKADAIVTNLRNLNIAIVTADCAPILFFDEVKKIAAVAHAGWRGAKAGVIENVVLEMKKLGAENISAIIGPMIQQISYEVSKEFLEEFLVEDKGNSEFFIEGNIEGKYLFDLPSYTESKLAQSGVLKIENGRINTYMDERFFSFRRSTHLGEEDSGRNISIIIS